MSSCSQHPLDQLAWEVQQLREKLAQASHRRPENQTKRQEPRRLESNLNQNANNGTFLFSSSSRTSQQQPLLSSRGAVQTSVPPRAQRTASDPSRPAQRNNSKHTFLFGHQEPQSGQRYIPSPSAKLPKRPGNSHWSVGRKETPLWCVQFNTVQSRNSTRNMKSMCTWKSTDWHGFSIKFSRLATG